MVSQLDGIIGFLKTLRFQMSRCKPDEIIIAWDGKNGSKKRRSIVEDYKKGRKPAKLNRNYDFELIEPEKNKLYQRIKLDQYLSNLPVRQIIIDEIEADDIIGYLCGFLKERKIIVSADKDFYQLINNETIIFSPTKKYFVTTKKCFEEYKIYPKNFALAKAIVGDKSDNISGIRGIGFKNLLKYFSFFSEQEKIELEQIFEYSKNQSEKYNKFLENRDIIIRNLNAMQLDSPVISSQSIMKIKRALEEKLIFNSTDFRMKLIEDGISNIDDNFFLPFKILKLKGEQS